MQRISLVGKISEQSGVHPAERFSGYEEWTFGDDGLTARSMGHFDNDDYLYQLEHGDGGRRQ
jgi:hypothetical protein